MKNSRNAPTELNQISSGLIDSFGLMDDLAARMSSLEKAGKDNSAASAQQTANMAAIEELRKQLNFFAVQTSNRIRQLEGRADFTAAYRTRLEKLDLRVKQLLGTSLSQKAQQRLKVNDAAISDAYVLVICPAYPDDTSKYGGEFVQTRVNAYAKEGIRVHVFEFSEREQGRDVNHRKVDGIDVFSGGTRGLQRFLSSNKDYSRFCVHFMTQVLFDIIEPAIDLKKLAVWIHGYEARDYKRLLFNHDQQDLEKHGLFLEHLNNQRHALMRKLLNNPDIKKVFVSKYIKDVVAQDTGADMKSTFVIHNIINEQIFKPAVKKAHKRFNILWIRSFKSLNYSNDIARDAILELSRRPGFDQYKFDIYGEGRFWDECTLPLAGFENVHRHNHFLKQNEIAQIHGYNGVMLVPSRFDTQGVTLGEALSSGLVCVTNRVAAIPEFADPSCAMMCDPEDPIAIADAIEKLASDPKLFRKLSIKGARRVNEQCGYFQTVGREIAEIIL